ncbi:MAG: AsmA family protein, partial [Planctomycetota bacterium]
MKRIEKNSKARPRRKTATRILKLALALIVVLIVLVFFLVPAFVSSEKGRQIILAKINNSIDGQTNFADLSMGWFRGIKVADVGFNDSAGQITVQVRQIAAKVEIILKDKQAKKAESLRPEPSAGKRAQPIVLPIKKIDLVLNDGNLKVTDPKAKTVELSRINSKVNLRPLGQQTNLDLNMAVVDGGKASEIQVAGRITPKQQAGWTLEGTSGNLTVEVNDLDIESLGPIFALAGIEVQAKGLIAGRVKGEIKDGRFENLSGDIKGKNLHITSAELKGHRLRTSRLDVGIKLNREKETINIDNLQIKSDWAFVTAGGVV